MPNSKIEGTRYTVYSNRENVYSELAIAEFPEKADFSDHSPAMGEVLTIIADAVLDYLREKHNAPEVTVFREEDVGPALEHAAPRQIVYRTEEGTRPIDESDLVPFVGTAYGLALAHK